MSLIFHIVARTDIGCHRERNEDHILVGRLVKNRGWMELIVADDDDFIQNRGLLCAVADGIGGAPGGNIASNTALSALEDKFYHHEFELVQVKSEDCVQHLNDIIIETNQAVLQKGYEQAQWFGLGSTLTGVCLYQQQYWVFNAGDSRVYRYRQGFLTPLTDDNTLAAEAIKAGQLTVEEAKHSGLSNILSRFIGSNDDFGVTISDATMIEAGDCLLICSDGLFNMVNDEDIEKYLSEDNSPRELVNKLVDEAISAGGYDNISVILVTVSASS